MMGNTNYVEIRPLDASAAARWGGAPCQVCGAPCQNPHLGLEQVTHEQDITPTLYDCCRDLPGYGGKTRTMRYKSGRWAIGHRDCLVGFQGETDGYTSIFTEAA